MSPMPMKQSSQLDGSGTAVVETVKLSAANNAGVFIPKTESEIQVCCMSQRIMKSRSPRTPYRKRMLAP
jgi:hypothetical protein